MFTFTVIARMNTRSVSYNKSSVIRAIEKAGLTFAQKGVFLIVEVPSLEARRSLEYELRQVDRDVAYSIKVR